MADTILGGSGGMQNQLKQSTPSPLLVENLWYNAKLIKLDGWAFRACRFDNCLLIAETPHFVLDSCYIDNSTQVEVQGALINVAKLLNIRGYLLDERIRPVFNNDGTISIGV